MKLIKGRYDQDGLLFKHVISLSLHIHFIAPRFDFILFIFGFFSVLFHFISPFARIQLLWVMPDKYIRQKFHSFLLSEKDVPHMHIEYAFWDSLWGRVGVGFGDCVCVWVSVSVSVFGLGYAFARVLFPVTPPYLSYCHFCVRLRAFDWWIRLFTRQATTRGKHTHSRSSSASGWGPKAGVYAQIWK